MVFSGTLFSMNSCSALRVDPTVRTWDRIYSSKVFFDFWYLLAKCGYSQAQSRVGKRYLTGYGVPQDYVRGFQWSLKAAEQGFAPAENDVGVAYFNGYGVPADLTQAIMWHKKAAEAGYADAQFRLGNYYSEGSGVSKDLAKAFQWNLKAAEQGHVESEIAAASAYYHGDGVPQDYAKAFFWYEKAARQGNSWAQIMVADLYWAGNGVKKDLDSALLWAQKAEFQNQFQEDQEERAEVAKLVQKVRNGVSQQQQQEFEKIRMNYYLKYAKETNEIRKSTLYNQATAETNRVISQMKFLDWVGELTKLQSPKGGGSVEVTIMPGWRMPGYMGVFHVAYEAIVQDSSPVYQKLATLNLNDAVRFSGEFLSAQEKSITEEGTMRLPEFKVSLSDVDKVQAAVTSDIQ